MQDRKEIIRQMLADGAHYGQIAAKLDVSRERVRQIVVKAGMVNPRARRFGRSVASILTSVEAPVRDDKTASKTDISQKRLRELLHYNQSTGQWTWIAKNGKMNPGDSAGNSNPQGYVQIRVDGQLYMAHVLAWFYSFGQWPRNMVDHHNRNRSDNRLNNLRQATCSQNLGNVPAREGNTSGFKGVWRHGKKWTAEIAHIKLGTFDTPEQAAEAYEIAARVRFGQFARTS